MWKKRSKRARNAFSSLNFLISKPKLIRIDQPINQNRDDKWKNKNLAEGKLFKSLSSYNQYCDSYHLFITIKHEAQHLHVNLSLDSFDTKIDMECEE